MKKNFLKKLAGALAVIQVFGFCLPVYARDTAFSVGVEYRDKKMIDTRPIAKNAAIGFASCGMNSSYNVTPNTRNIKENISSTVLVFSGHGNYDHIRFNYYGGPSLPAAISTGQDGTRTTNDGITLSCVGLEDSSNNLHQTKLAVFAGCLTSDGTVSKSRTLPYAAALSGAQCAIGWRQKVNMSVLEHWMKNFVDGLAMNKTVEEATDYANNFHYLKEEKPKIVDYNIAGRKTIRLVYEAYQLKEALMGGLYEVKEDGSKESVLLTESSSLDGQIKGKEYKIPKDMDLEYSFYPQEHTALAEYLKNTLNPDFDLKDYDVTYVDRSDHDDGMDGCIIFDYMIGDFFTDVSYMFVISDGRVREVCVIGEPVQTQIPEPRDLPSEEELKQMALDYYDLPSDGYVVEEQTVTKIYETYTGKAYFSVATECKTPYDDYVRLLYQYPISQSEPVNDFMMDSI